MLLVDFSANTQEATDREGISKNSQLAEWVECCWQPREHNVTGISCTSNRDGDGGCFGSEMMMVASVPWCLIMSMMNTM